MTDDPAATLSGRTGAEVNGKSTRKDDASARAKRGSEDDRVFLAALRATMALVPTSAVLITVAAYVGFGVDGTHAIVIGPLIAISAWLVLGVVGSHCVTPMTADSRNYRMIREKHDRLKNRTMCLCPEDAGSREKAGKNFNRNGKNDSNNKIIDETARTIVCKQVQQECEEIQRRLDSGGMPWVTGMGYIELWRRIHRAEEALIRVQPYTEVLGGAMRDEARLVDSNMTNKKSLLERLRRAVAVLDRAETGKKLTYLAKTGQCALSEEERKNPEEVRMKATTILSEIRYQINYFRDNVSEGIILARNRLAGTSVVLGIATYALLALSIFAGASTDAIRVAAAYFLVGALTGLFARSQAEWTAETAVGDFGLSTVRLFHIPWLSGLAAIAGVLVTSVIDTQFMSHAQGGGATTNIAELFNDYRPSLFIVAAIFGLTPDLIIRRLTQQAESLKGDLQSTETSQSTKKTNKTTQDA